MARNRHVIEGVDELVVTTWDGEDRTVHVVAAALFSDLAIIEVATSLPDPVRIGEDPGVGDEVRAAGYPLGNEFAISAGPVLEYNTDPAEGKILAIDARIRPGNSGGPLIGEDGDLVGVVYAERLRDSAGAAIPVSRLEQMIDDAAFESVESCSENYLSIDDAASDVGVGSSDLPPPPTTSTTTTTLPPPPTQYQCPTGEPTATITDVRPVTQPTSYPDEPVYQDTEIEGSVTNSATATVDVVSVELEVDYGDGAPDTVYGFPDAYSLPPGSTSTISETWFGEGSEPPTVEVIAIDWDWSDIDDYLNCG